MVVIKPLVRLTTHSGSLHSAPLLSAEEGEEERQAKSSLTKLVQLWLWPLLYTAMALSLPVVVFTLLSLKGVSPNTVSSLLPTRIRRGTFTSTHHSHHRTVIPLKRIKSKINKFNKLNELNFDEKENNENLIWENKMLRNLMDDNEVDLHDFENAQYYGVITIGSGDEGERAEGGEGGEAGEGDKVSGTFEMIFDTGSSNLWVPSDQCGRSCGRHSRYSHGSSYHPNKRSFFIMYGSGPVKGFLSSDDVVVGNINLTNYTFAEVTDASGLGSSYSLGRFDGIFGLGWPSISVDGIEPPFTTMVERGLVHEPIFSFYLGLNDGEEGELTFGSVDSSRYEGDLVWANLATESYWLVDLSRVDVGESVEVSTDQTAIIDSGTSLIAGPTDQVKHLAHYLGATPLPMNPNQYTINCKLIHSAPSLGFTIGGARLSVSPEYYIMKLGKNPLLPCLLGIMGMDVGGKGSPQWILGDVFMRKYLTVFDYGRQRVGFGKAVSSKGGRGEEGGGEGGEHNVPVHRDGKHKERIWGRGDE